jgi:bifunctional UDP-N-acetylglucosamine pyrophosphorylase/glucosamine-1-phosphate N-acetyltransferase
MKSGLPKVMHDLCGRPMLAYVLEACREAGIADQWVVVGFGRESIVRGLGDVPGVRFVEQREQKGTAHAVMMCVEGLRDFHGDCVVIAGDMPMVRAATLRSLVESHRASAAAASIATTVLEDPAGYGRIVRGPEGEFERIVEHRDCDAAQLSIREVNPSYYCFDWPALAEVLPKIRPDNAKSEYYLTDALSLLRSAGRRVQAVTGVPAEDATGINSRADLAEVGRLMQRRIALGWMERGVTIVDPPTTWIDSRAQIGAETVIHPFSYIEGHARIGSGCVVGPFACVGDGAVLADGGHAGPGVLTALDTTLGDHRGTAGRRHVQVLRRPPAERGCAPGG